jgi:hypothetical protein
MTELNCRLTDIWQLSVKYSKVKSITMHNPANKLYFPSNSILFQNQWTLHHHLPKHVKINCLYICKFTSRYKTYRWSCGHFVVAYWGTKWLAREIQFVKKRFAKASNGNLFTTNCKNTPCLEYSQCFRHQFHSHFSTNLWSTTAVVFLCCKWMEPYVSVFFCLWFDHTSDSKTLVFSFHTVSYATNYS